MSSQSGKILAIVNNDQSSQLEYFVSNFGFEIKLANDGSAGIKLATEWQPDITIIDLNLPDQPGLQVLQELKENPANTDMPVIVLGDVDSSDAEEISIVCLSNGASEFLLQPIEMGKLMATIQNNLELVRSRRELKELNAKLEKEKKRLLKYFSEDIVEKILNEEISTELGGAKLNATILFFDIRGSTGIAESLDPLQFADLISMICGEVMNIIFENHGSVNKLLGDGILATFGCPVPNPDDATNSIKTALDIQSYFQKLNNSLPDYIHEPVRFGIGLAAGSVFAGNIGSSRRIEYTVLGDPVNLAARLQSMTAEAGCEVLLDENVKADVKIPIVHEHLKDVKVRGKEKTVQVYRLKGQGGS